MSNDIFSELEKTSIEGLTNQQLRALIERIRRTKVNVLLVGGTGVGKSSTINALFKIQKTKVGQSTQPETMEISSHHLDNLIIWDTPGFGDSSANDARYKEQIVKKLYEKDENGQYLIDLVILILDGSSRDYSSAYTIIKDVISPHLGEDGKNRLLVTINQADMAMKGRYWDHELNQPESKLMDFLNEKVLTTRKRIKEDTGLDIEPMYYSAGFKDGDEVQNPYNLSKLLSHILAHLPTKKRISVINDINENSENFKHNDKERDYQQDIKDTVEKSFWENVLGYSQELASKIGSVLVGAATVALDVVKDVTIETLKSENTRKVVTEYLKNIFSATKGK